MKRIGNVFLFALSLLPAACTTPPGEIHYVTMDPHPWVGVAFDDIVLRRGPPRSTFPMGNGDILAECVRIRSELIEARPYGAPIPGFPRRYSPPHVETYVCKTRFLIGPDRRVKSYSFDGDDCADET